MDLRTVVTFIAICLCYAQAEDKLIKCYQCRRSSDWMCGREPFEGEKVATCSGLSCTKTYNEEKTLVIERNCQAVKCSEKKYTPKDNIGTGEGQTPKPICCESRLCNSSRNVTPSLQLAFLAFLSFVGFVRYVSH